MAVSCDVIKAYATQFLPQFQFADYERIYPVSAESWLQQCAQGDWDNDTDPHRGTADVVASKPLRLGGLSVRAGCNGVTQGGPAGSPIDPTQPLAFVNSPEMESFLDFAGWSSLPESDGFTAGDDDYIRAYFSPYFSKFNSSLSQGNPPPPTRTPPTLPTNMLVYCEGAWAGDFTRLSIQNKLSDFALPPMSDPNAQTPDPTLDKFFVLTYYLFYPCTEPPPSSVSPNVPSPNQFFREGQWEAVSLYFKSASDIVRSAADLTLPTDPSKVTPDFAVLSNGITSSGDGRSPGIAFSYPANVGSWSQGGQIVKTGGFPSYGKTLVPQQVYVTSGTHKNLFSPTPTSTTTTQDPAWTATGGLLEGAGGLVAGATGGTGVGLVIGAILALAGFLMQLFGKDSSTSPEPDPAGDVATTSGPAAGAVPAAADSTFVNAQLVAFSVLPNNAGCEPPAWWSYPGRWGVAMESGMSNWDSGGRRIDFQGRSRAYWNTVWLQTQLD